MIAVTADAYSLVVHTMLERTPFSVFTIQLRNGLKLEIDHPDAIMVLQGLSIFSAPGSIPVLFDHECVNHIVDAPASDAPNGPHR